MTSDSRTTSWPRSGLFNFNNLDFACDKRKSAFRHAQTVLRHVQTVLDQEDSNAAPETWAQKKPPLGAVRFGKHGEGQLLLGRRPLPALFLVSLQGGGASINGTPVFRNKGV